MGYAPHSGRGRTADGTVSPYFHRIPCIPRPLTLCHLQDLVRRTLRRTLYTPIGPTVASRFTHIQFHFCAQCTRLERVVVVPGYPGTYRRPSCRRGPNQRGTVTITSPCQWLSCYPVQRWVCSRKVCRSACYTNKGGKKGSADGKAREGWGERNKDAKKA